MATSQDPTNPDELRPCLVPGSSPTGNSNQQPSAEFHKFQEYLRRHGHIDLAGLEDELRGQLRQLVARMIAQDDDGCTLQNLADRLLIRYSLAFAIASTQDLPPLADDEESAAAEIMSPHREQMRSYVRFFPESMRANIANPEGMDTKTRERLERLIQLKPVARPDPYLPEPLFQEKSDLRLDRDYTPNQPISIAAIWGQFDTKALLGYSRRARYWIDRLIRSCNLGTSKLARPPGS